MRSIIRKFYNSRLDFSTVLKTSSEYIFNSEEFKSAYSLKFRYIYYF